jgi:hypothetical protein
MTESTTSTLAASSYDPTRVVADLRSLADRTGGPEGSRRLCWTPEWLEARTMLRESLATLPVDVETDEAGNLWAYLRGERDDTVLVGSHLDSVPKGGWLDGALGVMAGLELLRALAAEGTPPVTVALVDWADEEGARFGRSLFGSAACVGTLDIDVLRGLADKEGGRLPETLAEHGVDIERLDGARAFVLNSAAPICDAQGRISGSAVVIRDITELKKAQIQLIDSQRLAKVGSWELDIAAGRFTTSEYCRVVFGLGGGGAGASAPNFKPKSGCIS